MQHNNATNSNNSGQFLSLSHFDNELQQQAQFVIQQDMQNWGEFDHYLPPVNYAQPVNQVTSPHSCQSIPSPINNDKCKLEYTSPDKLSCFTNSPPFDDPDTIIQQHHSPMFNDQHFNSSTSRGSTPLQTPSESPKNDLLNCSFNFQFNETNTDKPLQVTDKTTIPSLTRDDSPPPQQKKSAHNAIERRYRNNINDRIAELKNAVPALLYAKVKDNANRTSHKRGHQDDDDDEDGQEYLDGVAVATKLNKATILRKATEYIVHLKHKEEEMKQENSTLQHLLSQLPGGYEILNRYQSQKLHREQEMHRQRMQERALQKQQQQKQRKANRKRSRHTSPDSITSSNSDNTNNHFFMPILHEQQQQPVPNRVFMAVFMAMTFFSSSPVSTKVYSNHVSGAQEFNNPIFSWYSIKTAMFIMFLFQILSPVVYSCFAYIARARKIPKRPKNNIMAIPENNMKTIQFHKKSLDKALKKISTCFMTRHDIAPKCFNPQQVQRFANHSRMAFAWLRNLITSINN